MTRSILTVNIDDCRATGDRFYSSARSFAPRGDRGPADLATPMTSHVRCRTARGLSALGLGLDEPTNHLSVKETAKVLGFVKGLAAQNVTGIFVSHNLHHVFVS